ALVLAGSVDENGLCGQPESAEGSPRPRGRLWESTEEKRQPMHSDTWTSSSWQQKHLDQPVIYPDERKLQTTLESLARLPPLVTSWEVETLKRQLAEASRGERFLLQGGDCCEVFADCEAATIARKLKIILQMSVILLYGCKKRVILVGRYAGQFAKPRTSLTE